MTRMNRGLVVLLVLLSACAAQAQSLGVPLEKFTGTWCGWCPYGAWVLDSIQSRLGDRAVVLAWHFDDKFEIAAQDTLSAQVSNGGHPVVSIARTPVVSLQQLHFSEAHDWYVRTVEKLAQEPPVDLDLASLSYDPMTRQIDVMVTMTPNDEHMAILESVRAVVVLTEDDLPEDQKLYQESGGSLPDLQDYPHKNVVRQVAGSILGDSMRYAWGPGWFFQPYSFTLDAIGNPAKTRVNVIVYYDTSETGRVVIATRSAYLSIPSSVDPKTATSINIYPNPASDKLRVECDENTLVEFTNVAGSIVLRTAVSNGEVDITNLSAGVYFVSVSLRGEKLNQRLIVR